MLNIIRVTIYIVGENMKNKKNLFFVLLLFLSIGATLAYFTSTATLENTFNSGKYKTTTEEEFVSPTNWRPGETISKTITTTNNGTLPVMVRVKFNENWKSENNNDLALTYNGEDVAIINFDNTDDWKFDGEYYYYKYQLEPGDSTSSLIEGVTFNPNVPSNVSCGEDNGVYTCESTGDGYDGATYTLGIITETVQADKYQSIWGVNVNKIVTPNPCTFEGQLVQGAEYVNGQYTYRYMQEYTGLSNWQNIEDDGWGVRLTDLQSTDPVTTKLCTSINNKPIVSMSGMFLQSQATSIDLSSFDTSNVTHMGGMFAASQVTSLDFSNFDTRNVTNMDSMFYNCQATTLDLSSFDTSKVTDMSYMFMSSQATTLDLSSFDTSKVTDMSGMFYNCRATTLDLSSFDTSKVTNMLEMFSGSHATTLDLSSFDTSSVTDMSYMFEEASASLINISTFDNSNNNADTYGMFCSVNQNNIMSGNNFTFNDEMFSCHNMS